MKCNCLTKGGRQVPAGGEGTADLTVAERQYLSFDLMVADILNARRLHDGNEQGMTAAIQRHLADVMQQSAGISLVTPDGFLRGGLEVGL